MTDALSLFLDMMSAERGVAQNTLQAYERDIVQFLEICGVQPREITAESIAFFARFLNEHDYAVKSVNRKLSAVKDFCKFLYEEKVLKENPLPDIVMPKREKRLPKFLTKDQVEAFFKAAKSHKNKALMRAGIMTKLMFATGLRVSEVVGLPLAAVSFDKKQIIVKGKGAKERVVFFDDETKKLLFEFIQNIRPFFINSKKENLFLFASKTAVSGHITRDAFFKNIKELAVLSGILPSFVSPHTLRHSFATNLINHDVDLRSVQKMLGHENIATTEIYTHIASNKIIKDALEKHPLKDFKL